MPRSESKTRKYVKGNDKYQKTTLYPNKESYDLAKKEYASLNKQNAGT